jgi:hypothetical protein
MDKLDVAPKVESVVEPVDDAQDEGIEILDDSPVEEDVEVEGVKPDRPEPSTADAGSKEPAVKAPKTFSETEVQRIVKERLKSFGPAKEVVERLKTLGYKDEGEILAKLDAELNAQRAQKLGVADPNAVVQFVREEVERHPAVQEAKQRTLENKIQSEMVDVFKRYPDATQEEVLEALQHQAQNNLPSLRAAYLDKFQDKIEEKMRLKATEKREEADKRTTEPSGDAPRSKPSSKPITATKDEYDWADRRVKAGDYKTRRDALESLQKTKSTGKYR